MGTVYIQHMKPRVYFSRAHGCWLVYNTQQCPGYIRLKAIDLAQRMNAVPKKGTTSHRGEKQ